jgi:lipopolysaccharide export system permease protein
LIIRDYIIKEILRTFAAVFLILFLILLSTQLLRYLSAVADGKVPIELFFMMLGLRNLESMSLLLPLSLFLSVLLALSRLYKDSEMIALASCGSGPSTLLKSVLILSFTFIIVEGSLALFLSPLANRQIEIMKEEFKSTSDVETISAGQFNISKDSSRVLYAARKTENNELENVFLHLRNKNNQSVLSAEDARLVTDKNLGARYIIFQNGNRYDGVPGTLEYRHIKYKDYGIHIQGKSVGEIDFEKYSLTMAELLTMTDSKAISEIQWRLSLVISIILLPMLAVPLSKSTPRKGPYAKFAVALLVYIVYTNLLTISQSWIKKDKIDPLIGLWWVHGLFFLLFMVLFAKQMGWFNRLGILFRTSAK